MTLPAVGGSTSRVTGESANQTEQMSFTKPNDVIEQLAA